MASRSVWVCVPLPALTTSSRKACMASAVWPRVVAGAHHALAGGQVFLQIGQGCLALADVAQRNVVLVGGAHPIERVAHCGLRSGLQRPRPWIRVSKIL